MKWIGQSIIDFIARFRSDVYLESIADHGSDPDRFLTMDSSTGKVTYRTGSEVFSDIGAASGDITSVVAGDGLTGGATSGAATIDVAAGNLIDVQANQVDVDLSELSASTDSAVGHQFVVIDEEDGQHKLNKDNINISDFNNDAGYAAGDITGVTAGTNLSGGGTTGAVTLNVDDAFLINSGSDTTTGTITAAGFTTTGTWTFDEHTSGTIGITTVQDSGTTFNDNDTSLMTAAAIDDRINANVAGGIGQYAVLRSSAFYLNDNPMVQNSLYFGSAIGNTPWNWNDPQAAGGAITSTASFTIAEDDMNWGIILPFDISKVEVQCSFRTALGSGDNFVMAIYTGIRSNSSNTVLTLTKRATNTEAFTPSQYVTNDVSYTADLTAGTMIYVGIGTEDSTNAKQGRGLMNISVIRR